MKKYILFILIFYHFNMQAQWELQYPANSGIYSDVYCITADTVVVTTGNTLLRTVNGGQDWNTISGLGNELLNQIDFIDFSTGFVLGNNNTLLKTINAGENWQLLSLNFSANILSISCTDTSLFVSGESGFLSKSTDFGTTWNDIPTGLTDDIKIKMIDDNTGFALYSNQILKTTDGGLTWNTLSCSGDQYHLFDVEGNDVVIEYYDANSSSWITSLSGDALQTCNLVGQGENVAIADVIQVVDDTSFWLPINIPGCMVIYPVMVKYEASDTDPYTFCDLTELFYENSYDEPYYTAIDSYDETVYVVGNQGGQGFILKNPTGINCDNYVNSIDELQAGYFSIYPNPNKGIFSLKAEKLDGSSYRILDLQGKELVPETQIGEKSIDVSFLPAGVYFIELINPDGVFSQKLIIE